MNFFGNNIKFNNKHIYYEGNEPSANNILTNDGQSVQNHLNQLSITTESINSVVPVSIQNTVCGTIQDIEILGNTYQNPSNLAEIKSVGKLREDGLYEVTLKTKNNDSTKETIATIKLPCQLEGIGDIKDRFYFDKQQGKWFIEKRIGETILTESNSWQYMSGFDSDNHMGFFLTDMPNMEIQPVFSDKFKNSSNINLDEELVAMTTPGGNKRLFLKIAKTKLTTQDVNGLKNWLKTNNVLVKYVISPSAYQLIELPLDTQIVLNSFDGITHIELDGGETQGTIKCKVSKSLKSSVNSLVEKTDNLDNRVKQIEGLKESQSLAYQSPKGSLVCTDTKNGVIEDLKISGRTLVNLVDTSSSRIYHTQAGGSITKIDNGFRINFSSYQWAGGEIPIKHLEQGKTYTVLINVLKNTCTQSIDLTHKSLLESDNSTISAGYTGTKITKFTYTGTTGEQKFNLYVNKTGSSTNEYVEVQYMVIEGDHTNYNLEYFEEIKNVEGDYYGRNLLRNSNNVVTNNDYYTKGYQLTQKPINNEYYTLTLKADLPPDSYLEVYNSGGDDYLGYLDKEIESGIYSTTFKWKSNSSDSSLYIFTLPNQSQTKTIYWAKLEKGKKRTDWSPAPEDIDGIKPQPISLVSINENNIKKQQIKPLLYYDNNRNIVAISELREWDTIEKRSDGKYYYYKRSNEIVLNGSENWTHNHNTPEGICFFYTIISDLISAQPKPLNNRLPYNVLFFSGNQETVTTSNNDNKIIYIGISQDKIQNSTDPIQLKQWLQANNITVVYPLTQEEVYECVDLTLSSYEGTTNFQIITSAIKPNVEFKISSYINNIILSNRDRINNIEEDFIDHVISQNAIMLETRYMLDIMLPNNIDNYDNDIDYNIYELLKKNIENDNNYIKKNKLVEMLNFYLNVNKITQSMYDELLSKFTRNKKITDMKYGNIEME